MIISIGGKCNDMGWFQVGALKIDHNGYLPYGLGIGGGDYIEIDIENSTGKIVGWKPLTEEQIREALENE